MPISHLTYIAPIYELKNKVFLSFEEYTYTYAQSDGDQ